VEERQNSNQTFKAGYHDGYSTGFSDGNNGINKIENV
jgi:hypothetical protein